MAIFKISKTLRAAIAAGVLTVGLGAGPAEAQILGVGPRFSFVRGDLASNTPTTRFVGGTVRLKLSSMLTVEGAADLRTTWSSDRALRLREVPLQGSLLLTPVRGLITPYLVGGLGLYRRHYDAITNDIVTASADERKVGVHMGFGGEVAVARHAVLYLDYRYRFVHFGSDDTTITTRSSDGLVPGGSLSVASLLGNVPGLGLLKVSHEGSMWTGGVAFVF